MSTESRLGITTTIPVEVVLAAELVPVDLNNVFISSPNPAALVSSAEQAGLPTSSCAWLKGIYSACLSQGITRLVAVTRGDCSGSEALAEILEDKGVQVVRFAYPPSPSPPAMLNALREFATLLGTDLTAAESWRRQLLPHRELLQELDQLAGVTHQVNAADAHSWMVSASDFQGNPGRYHDALAAFIRSARSYPSATPPIPVALLGVPPIAQDLFAVLRELGAGIVYNEVPHEFTMMESRTLSLEHIYSQYTYPYSTQERIRRIRTMVAQRRVAGLIHYQQDFCHRQLTGLLLRKSVDLPVLSLHCDRPGLLGAAQRTRLESFIEMLMSRAVSK